MSNIQTEKQKKEKEIKPKEISQFNPGSFIKEKDTSLINASKIKSKLKDLSSSKIDFRSTMRETTTSFFTKYSTKKIDGQSLIMEKAEKPKLNQTA